MRTYTVVFEREEDGGYSAWAPDLPGCASQGETYDEAMANMREAIECYIEAHEKLGRPLPEPRTQIETVQVGAA
jgi:predicted RNase H-like HicB family nuclease